MASKHTVVKFNKTKNWFSRKTNKIDKPLCYGKENRGCKINFYNKWKRIVYNHIHRKIIRIF